ncbi:hypothetical protein [Aquirufa rosea]|uniref:Uncharacterized protein n=1 Tax=Aquirufa rosea TaxID=2509241 RepID=A0A4V1M598_9BACT|nr:hypothetical protein [Aquirufa rosea]RXK47600.1 hypothetical protein ESB04_10195 [Aquirufa rosea]
MNIKLLKSLMLSLVLVWIVFYATEGIVKTLAGMAFMTKYRWWMVGIILLLSGITLYLILAPYHMFGPSPQDGYYSLGVTAQISYFIIGCGLNFISQLEEKKILEVS